jgi:rhodanese-related sulfurtransferase
MKRILASLIAAALVASAPTLALAGDDHCKASTQECLDVMTRQLATRGWLGVELEPAPAGMMITRVLDESPAMKSGLAKGDVVVSANGVKYAGMDEKGDAAIRAAFTPGSVITFGTERDGKDREVKVTLSPMPDTVKAQIIGMHLMMEHSAAAAGARASMQELSVEEVAKLVQSGKATVVDANGKEVRQQWGVIPGATLLTSSSSYAAGELPSDKERMLVFYCANTRCTACESAAKLAQERGYGHVAVMRAGIMGWKDAGQKTATPST